MQPLSRLARLTAMGATILLVTGLAALLPAVESPSSPCPAGYRLVDIRELREEFRPGVFAEGGERAEEELRERAEEGGRRAEEGEEGEEEAVCISSKHPEPLAEIAGIHAERAARVTAPFSALPPGAFRLALAERDALRAAAPNVPGSGAQWEPYGRGPLIYNDERYKSVSRLGFVHLAGRVDSLDYDPANGRVFALIGTGGVWMSEDRAQTWRSIGDRLPTQVNGALAWTPAGGGTLAVVSGEHTMGSNTHTGLGAFWTNDLGATWHQASGVPDGALGFQVAVDPTNPAVIYVATSKGLYRSTDVGRTYKNVSLPTGECAGRTDDQRCIFANFVTDVVVQAADGFGNRGGEVLAAVGFRGGSAATRWPDGEPYAPYNGLYRSATGTPGSFVKLPAPGFAPQERIGRVELGVAEGPAQNHDYVYAIVQDAVLLAGGVGVIDAPEDVKGPPPAKFNTNLNGVYVSGDFGQTWKLMADETAISESPLTGSGLIGVAQIVNRFAPGIQAWFNLFIKPDPTRQTSDGIPTRLTFGLEEVWQNRHTDQPQDGASEFKVIGRYFAGESCLLLQTPAPVCPTNDPPTQSTTTHPDQHDAIYLPDGAGGVTLVVGNDGGVYTQHAAPGEEFTNTRWGSGDNEGFNTLLPYHAVMSKDGTVWFGLQDNGTAKIEPDRRQYGTLGGDGFFVAVDPDDSDVAYAETPGGAMQVTTDGGRTWSNIAPLITNARFSNPFVMDPTDSDHLMTAGREVVETIAGPKTLRVSPQGWMKVFDLGTRNHPGDPMAQADEQDPANSMSALDLHGDAAYVGFCGHCDLLEHTEAGFQRGLATNVDGDRPRRRMTANGWHFAAARGLPNRWISSIAVDPADPRTVYVTLGGYGPGAAGRQWVPPGSYLDPNQDIGRGHVFKSVDAGETFVDISGNLPDAPAYWVVLRGSQLLLGTDVGPFISRDTQGGDWAVLGTGLPNVPISTLELAPHDPNLVVAATYGRGVWTYRLPTSGSTNPPSQAAVPLPSAGDPALPPTAVPAVIPSELLAPPVAGALVAAEVLTAAAFVTDGPTDAVCAAAVHLSARVTRLERFLGCARALPATGLVHD